MKKKTEKKNAQELSVCNYKFDLMLCVVILEYMYIGLQMCMLGHKSQKKKKDY